MGLCVGVLEGDVAEPLGPGELAGALDGGRGDVDPKRAACLGRARGLPGRLPGPAADVQDVVVELDATGPAQHRVVPPQLGVIAAGAGRMFACGVPHRGPFTVAGAAWAVLATGVHHGCTPPLRPPEGRLARQRPAGTLSAREGMPRCYCDQLMRSRPATRATSPAGHAKTRATSSTAAPDARNRIS